MTMIKPEMKEKIVRAAESLRSEGVAKPTNEQVRERMGGGSLSHISPVMREWRASQEQSDIVVIELPGELKAGFDRVAAELWQVASKLAAADIEVVKAHAAEHVAMADQERDEALDEVARLESELDRCRVAVSEKEAETRAALSEKITIEQKAIGLASEVERLTQELAACRQSIESFTSDNATLTANLKAANQEIDKLAKANQDNQGSIEALKEERATLTANLKAANQEIDKLAKANQDNQGSIEALKEERATLTASLKAANQEIDKLTKPAAKRQQKKDAADTKE